MNVKTLRKNYDKLTVRERFAALVAAASRDDEDERRALLAAAPRRTYSLPHHYWLSADFCTLTMLFRLMQLERAGLLVLTFYFDSERNSSSGRNSDSRLEAVFSCLETLAASLRRDDAAWRQVCAEYGIDPVATLEVLPGSDLAAFGAELARILAPDEPEAAVVGEAARGMRKVIEPIAEDA